MFTKTALTIAAGAVLAMGNVAMAQQAPVALPNGTTITPSSPTTNSQQALQMPADCSNIYESFNDTYPPNYGSGWTISDWPTIGCWGPSSKFTSDGDYDLCHIYCSATFVLGTNQFDISLYNDDGDGTIPGTLIQSWRFTDIPDNVAAPTPLLDCDASGIHLTNGTSYWLSITCSGGNSDTWGVLRQSTIPGLLAPSASNQCGVWAAFGDSTPGAWQVTANTGGGGYTASASGTCPGTVTVGWDGAAANATQGLVFAGGTGSFAIPNGQPCAGTVLGLSNSHIRLVLTRSTGSGSGSVNGNASQGSCGGYVQWVTAGTCVTSTVAQLP